MLARIRMLREAARLLRDPDRLGDGAILKSEAAGVRATPEVEAKLAAVRGFVPEIDLERLRSLPPGTLGRAYADFMHDNGLHPFRVTDAYRPLAAKNTFAPVLSGSLSWTRVCWPLKLLARSANPGIWTPDSLAITASITRSATQ